MSQQKLLLEEFHKMYNTFYACDSPKFCNEDRFKQLFGRTRPESSHRPIIRIRSYNRVAKLGRFCPLFNHCPQESKLGYIQM